MGKRQRVRVELRQMSLRVLTDELDAFRKAADDTGLPLSLWARTMLRRAAGLPSV